MTSKSFQSVFGPTGLYSGCLIHTAKGWRCYDASDKTLGYFSNPDAARVALLEQGYGHIDARLLWVAGSRDVPSGGNRATFGTIVMLEVGD